MTYLQTGPSVLRDDCQLPCVLSGGYSPIPICRSPVLCAWRGSGVRFASGSQWEKTDNQRIPKRNSNRMVANGKEVDHFTDDDESDLEIDYTDIEERFRPKFQDTFDNLIVVEGAPVVDESKRARLIKAIISTFAKKDLKISESKIEMPLDANNQSKGSGHCLHKEK